MDLGGLIPLDETHSLRREPCYLPHLQRIRDRHFYPEVSTQTFVIEVPLDELADWNGTKGEELAQRASKNAVRYHQLFCTVLDEAIANLQPTK